MSNKVAEFVRSVGLFCPDDGAPLEYRGDYLDCASCGREFPIFGGEIIELLPKAPTHLQLPSDQSYTQGYLGEFSRPFRWIDGAQAWGAPGQNPPVWVEKRRRQVRWALSLLQADCEADRQLFCDLSAGAGYYTLEYSRHFQHVLHCDLSIESINYAYSQSKKYSIENIIFLRLDYLKNPFSNNIKNLLCFDTLGYGKEHERLLLRSIKGALVPGGRALVDFHNWWHSPLRRIGLLPKNYPSRGSYGRRRVEQFLREAGLARYEFFPFYQEFERHGIIGQLGSFIIPPTRLVYRVVAQDD